MIGTDVKIIEYSRKVDFGNTLTHAAGAVLSLAGLIFMLASSDSGRERLCSLIYGLSLIAVYTVSSIYHGLKPSEAKRIARLVDHSTVPLLIAGTTTPCALISLYDVSPIHGITVLCMAWFCALFGIFSKLFFFEKLKAVTMAVYMISGAVMLLSAVPRLDELESKGFWWLVVGCVFYVIGAILCGMGVKRPYLHIVFHIFILIASSIHFFAVYNYILLVH